jgi:four helix bundle protein
MNFEYKQFKTECDQEIKLQGQDSVLQNTTHEWINLANKRRYSYHFEWLGRPIIQYPQDIVAMQEIIWLVKPDLIVETGIAHGGSLIFSASMLALLDMYDAIESGEKLTPKESKRKVLGIDIDIRAHNRAAIEAHPMASRIQMIQGSSIAPEIVAQVQALARPHERVLVCLDSNHTHDHVLAELEAYAPLTSVGSYCVVFDTIIEDMPEGSFPDRPWGKGNNPKTAVWEYLRCLKGEGRKASDGAPLNFEIDKSIENKLLITVAPDGYLKRGVRGEMMGKFRDLQVWQLAKEPAVDIYRITQKGDFSRDYGFKDQIRQAAVSIASNLAEGDERGSNKDAMRFFYIAKGSLAEVQTQLEIAREIDYIDEQHFKEVDEKCSILGKMLGSLIKTRSHTANPYNP